MKKRILDMLLGGAMFFLWVCSLSFAFFDLQARGAEGEPVAFVIYAALTVAPFFLYRFIAGKFGLNRPASAQCAGCGSVYDGQLDACPSCGKSPAASPSRWKRADSIGLAAVMALVIGGALTVRNAVVGSDDCFSQKQALINLSQAQEIYFTEHGTYAKKVEDLGNDYQKVEGVTLQALKADENNYIYTASHPGCARGPTTWNHRE